MEQERRLPRPRPAAKLTPASCGSDKPCPFFYVLLYLFMIFMYLGYYIYDFIFK